METAHLHEYITLAKTQSFTRAAGELAITQSALSKHVATLERELGCELFVRNGRGVVLTQAGAVLYEKALIAEHLLKQTRMAVRDAVNAPAEEGPVFDTDIQPDIALRCACNLVARRYGLTAAEHTALVGFLEEHGFAAIEDELDLNRDELGALLGGIYRKLGVHDKDQLVALIHSISE